MTILYLDLVKKKNPSYVPKMYNVVVSQNVWERRLVCWWGATPLTSVFNRPTNGPRRAVTTHDDSAAAGEWRVGGRRVRKNRWLCTDMPCTCVCARARCGLELLVARDGGTRRRRKNITSGRERALWGIRCERRFGWRHENGGKHVVPWCAVRGAGTDP